MTTQPQRHALMHSLFPTGIPRLWCPMLTHFHADGRIDEQRMRAHLEHLSPYVQGLLIPGSTGEGWDLDDARVRELLTVTTQAAREWGAKLLIGVLRRDLDSMLAVIQSTVNWLCDETGKATGTTAMLAANVVGFTVCPPTGPGLSQETIRESLAAVLELGHPTALYQLPQVTQNEMAPECVAELAANYPNFYLLKDTSGADRVVLSGVDLQGVFLVRGAEGQYSRWARAAGGPYDGFLLSTANCFARELAEVMDMATAGHVDDAARLAQRIENAVEACFLLVRDFPAANPFTNANKIVDHVMAYGAGAWNQDPPYLHNGQQLPAELVKQAEEILQQQDLTPPYGYL